MNGTQLSQTLDSDIHAQLMVNNSASYCIIIPSMPDRRFSLLNVCQDCQKQWQIGCTNLHLKAYINMRNPQNSSQLDEVIILEMHKFKEYSQNQEPKEKMYGFAWTSVIGPMTQPYYSCLFVGGRREQFCSSVEGISVKLVQQPKHGGNQCFCLSMARFSIMQTHHISLFFFKMSKGY